MIISFSGHSPCIPSRRRCGKESKRYVRFRPEKFLRFYVLKGRNAGLAAFLFRIGGIVGKTIAKVLSVYG